MNNPYNAPGATLSGDMASDQTYDPEVLAVNGRIGRLRYIAYSMAISISLSIVMVILMVLLGTISQKVALLGLILYVPILAYYFILAIRRLNDMGHPGWWSLLQIIPLINLVFYLWLIFGRGDDGNNAYGPAPAGPNSGLVIAGACVLPLIFIVGILAAIAVPQYAKYVERAKAANVAPAPEQVQP